MYFNFIKTAFRQMIRNKGYTFIHLFGLTLSMSICLLIFLWVDNEKSYDTFHQDSERIYRAQWHARYGDNEWRVALVPMPVGYTLEQQFPEVESMTQFYQGGLSFRQESEYNREKNGLFIDPGFFEVFSVEFIQGDKSSLAGPNDIILTREMADRYFQGENPIGRELESNDGSKFQVKAVVRSFPSTSHFGFDYLASLDYISFLKNRKNQWGSASVFTYLKIHEGSDIQLLQEKFDSYVQKNVVDGDFAQGDNFTSFPLQKLVEIHLDKKIEYDLAEGGDRTYVMIFSIIALLILVLACINFINLATARAITRAREVGVRKVLGSTRKLLIGQFYVESLVYVVIAMAGAYVVAIVLLPYFNLFTGKSIQLSLMSSPNLWLLIAIMLVGITVMAGFFPAFLMSSFQSVKALKGSIEGYNRKHYLRKSLVVFQFCISIGLIICTLMINRQVKFMQMGSLGFDQDHLLVIDRASALGSNYNAFLDRIRQEAMIEKAGGAQFLPGDEYDSMPFSPEQPANFESTSLNYTLVDEDLSETLRLKIIQGRNFEKNRLQDSSACMINEKAVERLGWQNPIGKTLRYGDQSLSVIGIVGDFNFKSLHHEIEPLILLPADFPLSKIVLRLNPGDLPKQIAGIEKLWRIMEINAPFEYSFLDQDFANLYLSEVQMGRVLKLFSFFSIIIGCLGLFGLSAYMVSQRKKEIGVRKVLGASIIGLLRLLTRDFLLLILFAGVITTPIVWLLLHQWLKNFAYQAGIDASIFILGILAGIIVTILTIGFQSLKAALADPVDSIRDE